MRFCVKDSVLHAIWGIIFIYVGHWESLLRNLNLICTIVVCCSIFPIFFLKQNVLTTIPNDVVLQLFVSQEENFKNCWHLPFFLCLAGCGNFHVIVFALMVVFQYYLFVIYLDETSGITFTAKRFM